MSGPCYPCCNSTALITVCVCACVRACVHACVCVCVRERERDGKIHCVTSLKIHSGRVEQLLCIQISNYPQFMCVYTLVHLLGVKVLLNVRQRRKVMPAAQHRRGTHTNYQQACLDESNLYIQKVKELFLSLNISIYFLNVFSILYNCIKLNRFENVKCTFIHLI